MKFAFTALYDLQDINRGSGTYYHIYRELCKQGHTVYPIKLSHFDFPFFSKVFRYISKRILNKKYRSYQDPFIGKKIGQQSKIALENLDYDVMITNDYSIAAYTKIKKPIILWTDAIFPSNYKTNIHPWLSNLPFYSVIFCQYIVKMALKNIALCFVPGDWNREEILKYNLINPDLVSVIPFGSNLPDPGKSITTKRNFKKIIKRGVIKLLFVGKDWSRKGGRIAVEIAQQLNRDGYNARLDIVGVDTIEKVNESFITFHGQLNKASEIDSKKMDKLYREADVFILPSSIEGFGIAYVEAASYGLPSLGFNTTGVRTAVQNGVSGKLFKLSSSSNVFSNGIKKWYSNPDQYNDMVSGARDYYSNTCNWADSVSKGLYLIQGVIS